MSTDLIRGGMSDLQEKIRFILTEELMPHVDYRLVDEVETAITSASGKIVALVAPV